MAIFVVFLWAPQLVAFVYGSAFIGAAKLLRILVVAGTLGSVYHVLVNGLRGMGRPGICTTAEVAGVIFGVAGLLLLVPTWGTEGAAFAIVIASGVSLLMILWFVWRARREYTLVMGSEVRK